MNRMKKIFTALVTLATIFVSGFAIGQQPKITVAVAANMQYAFNELKSEFAKSNNIEIDVVVGSSGNLTHQIMHGAPFDIFVSADTAYAAKIFKNNFAAEPPKVYAQGVLVLWTTKPNLKPEATLRFLLSNKIKRIALANPIIAPYGTAAEAILKKYNLMGRLAGKLVYGESITQTSQFIATQKADAGFTAKAIILSNQMKNKGIWIELNLNDYAPILQSAVLLKYGMKKNAAAAKTFYDFLYSARAKEIYKKYGYIVK